MKIQSVLEFDTRDKKPKLWALIPVTAVVLAAVIYLARTNVEAHTLTIGVILSLYYAGLLIYLIVSFVRQVNYNPYSYNTIYYMGFSFFIFTVLISHIVATVNAALHPDLYGFRDMMTLLMDSAKSYMLLSAPFILVFSVMLLVSNISLLRHERKRFVNVLGIILAFLLVAGEVALYAADYYVSGSFEEVRRHVLITNLFAAFYLYFECMVIGSIIADTLAAKYEPKRDKDYIIILGCNIRKDGTPTPLLRGRVDRAIAFAKKQKEETGKDLIFIPSGGQGPNEVIAESASMKQYLLEQGIPEEQIIEENQSANTFENMKFSKKIIYDRDPDAKIAYSTTNYHVFRSGVYARRNKMRAVGMGAKTKWWFWPNAAVREFVGLLKGHRLKQGIILGSIAASYIARTFVIFR